MHSPLKSAHKLRWCGRFLCCGLSAPIFSDRKTCWHQIQSKQINCLSWKLPIASVLYNQQYVIVDLESFFLWPLVQRQARSGLCLTPSWMAPNIEPGGLYPAGSNAGKLGNWFGFSLTHSLQPGRKIWMKYHQLAFSAELYLFNFW